ncbi:hypothetical protein GR255_27155, partial [Mycobacterium tuberculosis]|nr:hypothetical protein [Mycobacterium tuberculosis]
SQSTYCAVRFGNVLGSRGSVIPVFERQIAEGGPVTVTDFRMTRYFMTIPEASRLVIHAGAYAKDGEVFILDMGKPVKIYDLAKKMVLLSSQSTYCAVRFGNVLGSRGSVIPVFERQIAEGG